MNFAVLLVPRNLFRVCWWSPVETLGLSLWKPVGHFGNIWALRNEFRSTACIPKFISGLLVEPRQNPEIELVETRWPFRRYLGFAK